MKLVPSNSPNSARSAIRDIVQNIHPFDAVEAEHIAQTVAWIDSGAGLFRISKPDTPPMHLVSYFVLFDELQQSLMLIDHVKAGLWLPPGGHIDVNEHPKTTVEREAREELDIVAEFSTPFGDEPLFITVTQTVGPGTHTDVSVWYVIRGNADDALWFDTREMHGYKWLQLEQIAAMDAQDLDPHMHRFVAKFRRELR